MAEKKLALLLGQAEEAYQSEFVKGVMEQAFDVDMDVFVFSMYIKYQNTNKREKGDSNIFLLPDYASFDAVIVLADTIQTPGAVDKIEQRLHEEFTGSVIFVDRESQYFPTFWTDGFASVHALVSHLIEKHGKNDIAFLTGRAGHRHSERRLSAYKKAMEDHGLAVLDRRIFYGDFWYTSGVSCAELLLRDKEHMPEAVVCANDCMAMGLAEKLASSGIRIPEDIAVCGYGTSREGQDCPKSLTSTYIPARQYGIHVAQSVLNLMDGQQIEEMNIEPSLYLGESCGCSLARDITSRRDHWMSEQSEEGFYSIHNTFLGDLMDTDSMDDFLMVVYENIYQLKGIKRFDLCLCDPWLGGGQFRLHSFPTTGYGKKILWGVGYRSDKPGEGQIGLSRSFDVGRMLPETESRQPAGYLITPIFFREFSFGYGAISYGDRPESYDEAYRLWMTALTAGLESMRRRQKIMWIEKKLAFLEQIKQSEKELAARGESAEAADQKAKEKEELQESFKAVAKILDENLFTYHFQPIVRAGTGEIYSYEALMRSNTEKVISPLEILRQAEQMGRLRDVEKATFLNVLSIVEKNADTFQGRKVFINSIPGCGLEEEDDRKVMEGIRSKPGRVVIEMTEQAEISDDDLNTLKEKIRSSGAGMAVDDYGTGYSNVANLLRYMPDVVKIDRSLLADIQDSSQKQHLVSGIIEFCHANDILALAEGVETSEELRCVIRLGTDLIQGYYTGRPSAVVVEAIPESIQDEIIRYHQEAMDGSGGEIYTAGRASRIYLNHLTRDHKTKILIGAKDATYRDVTIVGDPGTESAIHIEVVKGFHGRLTLENVSLSNTRNRPCVLIGEESDLNLALVGANRMRGSGICVPENATLTVEGEGGLTISADLDEGYGIGNGPDRRHGDLFFYQDGELRMDINGRRIVGIGAGQGGNITIRAGVYDMFLAGDETVCAGALDGPALVDIKNCELGADVLADTGVCIGSLRNDANVELDSCKVSLKMEGRWGAAIGTLGGSKADITGSSMSLSITLYPDLGTGLGALSGQSDVRLSVATFRFSGGAVEPMVFGGRTEDTKVSVRNVNTTIDIEAEEGRISMLPVEQMDIENGRFRARVNGEKL